MKKSSNLKEFKSVNFVHFKTYIKHNLNDKKNIISFTAVCVYKNN